MLGATGALYVLMSKLLRTFYLLPLPTFTRFFFHLEREDGTPVSPFHDIPLYSNAEVRTYITCSSSHMLHVSVLPMPSLLLPYLPLFPHSEDCVQYGSGGAEVDQCQDGSESYILLLVFEILHSIIVVFGEVWD